MDALKKNAYWVFMGVLVLVAGVFYGVAVAAGKNAEIEKQRRKLDDQVKALQKFAGIPEEKAADPKEGVPVVELVNYWESKKKALEEETQEILKKYRARDREFERLFGASGDKPPDYTTWVTLFRKNLDELKEKYKALIEEGTPADRVFAIEEPKPGDDPKIPRAQKEFYVAQAIAAAAKAAGAKALVGMEFKDVSGKGGGGGGRGAAAESKEVERIACEVELKMPASSVPEIVAKILQSAVVFELRELKVEAVPFTLPEYEPFGLFLKSSMPGAAAPAGSGAVATIKGFEKDVYIATVDQGNPKTKDGPPALGEPAVGVKLLLHALDFELPEGGGEKEKAGGKKGK